jgi:hypothetical protein
VQTTVTAARLLRELLPDWPLNVALERILRSGTGHAFDRTHNREWKRHTRPILEACLHTRFMIDIAVCYSALTEPPRPLLSGYAALLYLFDLR